MVDGSQWLQAQYSVLGSLLIEPELTGKALLQLRETDFQGTCATVYKAIRKLYTDGQEVDPVSVGHLLGQKYMGFLAQLMEVTPTAANLDLYIKLCREQSRVVLVKDLAGELLRAENTDQVRRLLEQANSLMADKAGLKVQGMTDSLAAFFERKVTKTDYLSWPLQPLNEQLFVRPGDFVIQGGYPSAGKTAFALQCAWHWAGKHRVGFFSLETSPEKLFDRLVALVSGIPMGDIKRHQLKNADWDTLAAMSSEITGRQLDLIPAAGMTAADVRSVTMMKGYDIILIDYVQLLGSDGGNRTEQVTNISMSLHELAQGNGVTVVGLSQLKRSGDTGGKNGGPRNADLRESGQLEQDADVVMLLFLEKDAEPMGARVLRISKNKEGTTGEIVLDFDGRRQMFSKANRSKPIGKAMAAVRKAEKTGGKSAKELQEIFREELDKPPDVEQCSFDKLEDV